ncbi:SDR family oxidoreductase [Streptomyces rubiginosohelvolus]|uniref:SDR family NAD(P)-dependent oxidoreductase n=1 Tax=Streptomyces rubiginosohelvolus TaxID=67362 RepID=UPI0033B93877
MLSQHPGHSVTDLRGRTAIVTGSGRGIGRAIAVRLARRGAGVVVNYAHDEAAALQTVKDINAAGSEAIAVRADVSDPSALESMFEQCAAVFGRPDIVVANAGVEIIDQPISEVTEEQYDLLFAVNAKGAFFTLQKAARHIRDHGRILYIGSSTTCRSFPGVGLYGSSKMSARYTVEVLAQEVGDRGITVNSVLPTTIEGAGVFTEVPDDHPMRAAARAGRPLEGRFGTVEDVADAVEYFVGPLASWVSGQHLLISGGAQQ